MYRAIFIDIDDTLLDYIPCCREAFDAAMNGLTDDGMSEATDKRMDELFDLFFAISGRLFSEAKRGLHTVAEVMELYPREFIQEYRARSTEHRAQTELEMTDVFKHAFREAWGKTHTLVPGAREMLDGLRDKGYRLFAASNSFGHLQRSRLAHAGIADCFEDAFISMDIGYDKPDVRFYAEALRRARLQPHEVLMVGDSMTTDILGAQQAGLDTCWFNRRHERNDKAVPSMEIDDLRQLIDKL